MGKQDRPLRFGVAMLFSAMPLCPARVLPLEGGRWDVINPSPWTRCCSPMDRGQAGFGAAGGPWADTAELGVGWVLQSSRGCCQPVSNN